uniref:FAS1 domain-containing protein n=1 Tax=Aureoumbra lagunensis TaxID=44058 RepID=A0A6S8EK33_9STRA
MRIALILLAFIGDEVQAVPTLLECTRALEPGVEIMSSNAVLSTSVTVSFERDGETVACGEEYIPGETLTVVLSSTPTREMFEVTGGVLSTDGCGAYTGSESDGTNEENFCIDLGFSRCPKQGSSSQEMVAPSDGSDITAKVGFANGFGTVSITETCTLVAANDDTVVDLVIATDDLSILEDAVVLAELATTLSGDGPFTVFAPNNEAFQNLSEGDLTTLLNDIPALTDVLLYHVVSGTVLSTDLMDGMVVSTLLTDATFTVDLSNGVSFVFETGSASPVSVDNLASNGVVHIIDTVLIPPEEEPEPTDSTSWYKKGQPSKDCSWVAAFTKRCGVKGCWSCATLWCQRLGFYAC